jgi:hypothetical protein
MRASDARAGAHQDMDVSNSEGLPRGIRPQRDLQRQPQVGTYCETVGLRGGTRVATRTKCYAYAFTPAFSTIIGTIR